MGGGGGRGCFGEGKLQGSWRSTLLVLSLASTGNRLFAGSIHVVQNRRAGEQKSHWDKTNKENYSLKLCMSFVCLVPVRLLLTSTAVLYHVNATCKEPIIPGLSLHIWRDSGVIEREGLRSPY